MRKFLTLIIIFFSVFTVVAQEEFNAIVTVNADKVQSSNKQVYKTLQKSLSEFINQTKWTNKEFLPQERINCAFTIIINSQDNNNFKANIQVKATRPVYNSSYETPIVNINDSFSFRYNEYDPLIYNPTSFDSNLVSTIVFYVYTILGVDADTFALKGGESYFKSAEKVVLQAQQSNFSEWQNKVGEKSHFIFINNLLSPKFNTLRNTYYKYHRKGIDVFDEDENKAKKEILNSVLELAKLHNVTVGNYLLRFFLDAKSDEILDIFSGGKRIGKEEELKNVLQRIAPNHSNKWRKIRE
ncbi:MAG: DUF4835 family protein [Tenacibaculum sp.]|nr:DUF4835 family protein [Tenacibaculum sp.]